MQALEFQESRKQGDHFQLMNASDAGKTFKSRL